MDYKIALFHLSFVVWVNVLSRLPFEVCENGNITFFTKNKNMYVRKVSIYLIRNIFLTILVVQVKRHKLADAA